MNELRIAGLTEAEFDAKNAQHGGRLIAAGINVGNKEVQAILRPLTQGEYDALERQLIDARRKEQPLRQVFSNVVRAALVAPSPEEFNPDLQTYPALAERFADELLREAGEAAKVQRKSFR